MIWYRLLLICWICIVILLFPSENAKVVKKKPTCNSQKQLRTCANMLRTKVRKFAYFNVHNIDIAQFSIKLDSII
ncbi:hypothetical protein KSF78_0000269 [Schistosoma japonicum]|nr:hypothetical protein KSF78_0000269 [Schistosoma japonicum]